MGGMRRDFARRATGVLSNTREIHDGSTNNETQLSRSDQNSRNPRAGDGFPLFSFCGAGLEEAWLAPRLLSNSPGTSIDR